jgi:hypothetical protein
MIKEKNYSQSFFVIAGLVLTYFTLIFAFQAPLFNNGDYHRITHDLVSIPAYTSLTNACFPIDSKAFYLPLSTTSLFFEISLIINIALGKDCWTLNDFFLILSTIYLLGFCIYAKQNKRDIKVVLALIITPCFFSPFLKSLYEESVLLTLLPWIAISVHLAITQRRIIPLTIMSALLILTKIQLLILLPTLFLATHCFYKENNKKVLKITIYGSVMAIAIGLTIHGKQDSAPNSYNRLFNGIGWSMQEVSLWPAKNFIDRLEYFSKHQSELQQLTQSTELVEDLKLWGTSYWPTGLELFTSGNDSRWEKIQATLNLKKFLIFFYRHPKVIWSYFRNTFGVFMQSDYSIDYLQEAKSNTISFGLSDINQFCMQNLSWLYCFLLLAFLFSKRNFGLMTGALTLLLAPFFVVIGDGFFEYEKHMMPFFIALPILLILTPNFYRPNKYKNH